MPAVLSKRTADWLRSAMARDSSRGFRPRRIAYPGSFVQGMQWRISATPIAPAPEQEGEGDEPALGRVAIHVDGGLVAWGGCITYINAGADLGEFGPGDSGRIVWASAAPPVALVNDPRWPTGGAPDCECRDCDCRDATGNPSAGGGDSGVLLIVEDDWIPDGEITDCREIGSFEISDTGAASITQLQRDTIVVIAIADRDHSNDTKPEEVPPCGHPLNNQSDQHPLSHGSGWSGGGGGVEHPLDHPGDGGYTPLCDDDPTAAA